MTLLGTNEVNVVWFPVGDACLVPEAADFLTTLLLTKELKKHG